MKEKPKPREQQPQEEHEQAQMEPEASQATEAFPQGWGDMGNFGTSVPAPPTPPAPEAIGTNRPKWEVEDTHPELVEDLKKALRTVVDPELGIDIIALGLVRNIQVTDDEAKITMILTTPFCPYGPALLEMARQKVEMVVKKPTTLEIGNEVWDMTMLEDGEILKQWGLWF